MPIYEYQCRECGAKFEALRAIKDADNEIHCSKCSSITTYRVASACFSKTQGGTTSSHAGGCGSCSGGSCASCGH